MRQSPATPDELARAILDGRPIDWANVESTADPTAQAIIRQLRLVAAVAGVHRDQAVRPRWGHLEILEPIGHGASGVVYRAWDSRLDREVALKIRAFDAATDGPPTSSVIQEGRLLARVRHPNVVTVHGAEVIGDEIGVWMELVRGRTLEALLRQGHVFDADEVAAIGLELCGAVAAVHAAGLLHRDIKAQNAMRADNGHIVLMDLGTGRDRGDVEASDLAGTPLYLAPEVLRGEPATVQSDLYSLGVLLYRLATRSYPVRGETVAAIRDAHEREQRVVLRSARPDLGPLAVVIDRAIHTNVDRRYASADALATDLRALTTPAAASPPRIALLTVLGIAAIGLGGWWIAGRAAAGRHAVDTAAGRRAVVVMPFKEVGAAGESSDLAAGVTVALQQELTRIGGLDVRSQGSSRQFAGTAPSVVEAGRLAGVDLAVVGTVQQTGSSLRVSPQLIQISTDTPIWSDTVTRQLRAPADLFAAIDEITRSIGNRVRLTMRAGRQEPLPDLPTWAQFVEALRLQSRRGPDNVRATEIFQSIVERQPDFAPAWAGLAGVYGERAFSYPSVGGFAIAPAEAFQRIAPAAAKAMVLDGSLPEAHAARGHAHALAGEWEQAEAAFRRALELDPGATTISSDFVITTLMPTARLNEALNVLHLALRRDPLSADAVRVLAYVQLSSGQYDATLENCQRALDLSLQLTYAQEFCMRARVLKGDVADAIAFFETRGEGGEGWLGYAYASAGRRADAEALLKKVEGVPNRQALIYAGLRDASRTMDAIEKMAGVNVIRAASWLTYPEFHFLRDHPLAAEFRLRHRLPPPR